MEQYFDPNSNIMKTLSEIGDLILVNILWILTSLPVVTLGASTTAVYAVLKPRGKKDYDSSTVRRYFHAFRQNFRKSTLTFLIMLLPTAFALVNCWLFLAGYLNESIFRYIICALSVLLLLFGLNYLYPLIASFDNTILRNIVNAFLIALAHLPTTLTLTLLNLFPLMIYLVVPTLFYRTIMIWIMIGFSLIVKVNCLLLERVFQKYR